LLPYLIIDEFRNSTAFGWPAKGFAINQFRPLLGKYDLWMAVKQLRQTERVWGYRPSTFPKQNAESIDILAPNREW